MIKMDELYRVFVDLGRDDIQLSYEDSLNITDEEVAAMCASASILIDDFNNQKVITIATINLEDLRSERNRLLAETDWWMMPDRTATDDQIAYRQALRDITDTYDSINDVVWSTKPE
jgi:hypothetical protein